MKLRILSQRTMTTWSLTFLQTALIANLSAVAIYPATASTLRIGVLTCETSLGDAESLICDFRSEDGSPEAYSGVIEGFDPGTGTGSVVVTWSVGTKVKHVQSGDLAGDYIRVGNALVGGHKKSFALQALPDEQRADTDLAGSVRKITLIASN